MKRKSGYKTLIVSILALSLLPVFNLRAETKEEVQVPIYFRFNSEVYDPAVFSNQEAMRSIFQTIESLGWDRIESIEITGYSSPDGVYEVNNNISLHRARSVAKILRARYTEHARRVCVHAGGEAWPALRNSVASDTRLTDASREKVLRFLDDTSISNDTRKWRLQNWLKNDPNVGPIYPYILRTHYRKLRNSVVVVVHEVPDEPTPAPVQPKDTVAVAPQVQPADTLPQPQLPDTDSTRFGLIDTVAVAPQPDTLADPNALRDAHLAPTDTAATPADTYTVRRGFIPAAGISTNLPYDITYVPGYGVTSIPSLSFEYYPASRGRWTYGFDIEWPMWKHWNSQRFMQINNITVWGRRYFSDPEVRPQRTYLFGSLNATRFGVGFKQHGWIGEGLGASVGAGYKWPIGKSRFWFDAGGALGVFWSLYDPYVYGNDALGWYYYDYGGKPEDFKERNNGWLWFGPTRIYFSIGVDLFNRNRRAKQ